MEFWIITSWLAIGLLAVAGMLFHEYWKGQDILLRQIPPALWLTLAGPITLVVLGLAYVGDRVDEIDWGVLKKTVLIKGRRAKV